MPKLSKIIHEIGAKHQIPPEVLQTFDNFQKTYRKAAVSNGFPEETIEAFLIKHFELVVEDLDHPYKFEPFHEAIRKPFDFYKFGVDFFKPLIDWDQSAVYRMEILNRINEQIKKGENVVLLANHQTEPDPQIISILLEEKYPKLAEEMIFVAGHRVVSDPMSIPFSKGRNLLCIYSKKYIENPPELKLVKQLHNQKTMRKMSQLLDEGGKCIYVAPSGGRDRPNAQGVIEVDKFDGNSIEMFWLMTQQASKPTHFYPLTLATYTILPPPNSINIELGEVRSPKCAPVKIAFGEELDMENCGQDTALDKKSRRKIRADYIWNIVKNDYEYILKD